MLFAASRISPSLDINSVYITSAPCSLQSARNGGSLTSSIGANSKGKEPNSMFPILAIIRLFVDSVCRECLQCLHQLSHQLRHHSAHKPLVGFRLLNQKRC